MFPQKGVTILLNGLPPLSGSWSSFPKRWLCCWRDGPAAQLGCWGLQMAEQAGRQGHSARRGPDSLGEMLLGEGGAEGRQCLGEQGEVL